MSVWNKTGNSTWTKINSIFNKTGASTWTEIVSVWVKTASSTWTKVFTKLSVPANTVAPEITGSTYLYGTLSGTLGTWTSPNGTNSYARQWQSATNSNGTAGSFGNISGATSSTYPTTINENGRWVRLRVTATNLSGSSIAYSNEVLITKYSPVALTIPVINGSPSVNSTLTALTTVGTYWKNTTTISGDTAPDSFSYRWYWGDTGDNIGSDSSTYIVQNTDVGHTIRVEVTATNTGGSTSSISNATSTVGQSLQISGVNFTDVNGNSGFNNRSNVVTSTYTNISWSVSGVDTGTSFRFRYRIYNTQSGAYYNPASPGTTSTASTAWLSFSDTYYTLGTNLSGSINGSNATVSKAFNLSSTFNGSTWGGGLARWQLEYELSVTDSSGTRYYWVYGDGMDTTQTNDYYDIDPTSEGTISADPTSGNAGTSVTLSGQINSYPTALTSYPYAYRVVYGDGTNSGWQYQSYGVSNPTYSLSHTYNSIGSYTAYVETIPSYTTNSTTITIANAPVNTSLPTLSTDTNNYSAGSVITVGAGSWTNAQSYDYQLLYASSTPVASTSSTTSLNASNQYTITKSDATSPSYYFRGKVTAYSGLNKTGTSTVAYSDTSVRSTINPSTTISVASATSTGFTISGTASPIASPSVYVSVSAIYIYDSNQTLSTTIDTNMPTVSTSNGNWSYTWTGGSADTTYYAKVKVVSTDSENTAYTSGYSSSITTTSSFVTPTVNRPANFTFGRYNNGSSRRGVNWTWNHPSTSGSVDTSYGGGSGIVNYSWEIYTVSTGGTPLNSGSKGYNSSQNLYLISSPSGTTADSSNVSSGPYYQKMGSSADTAYTTSSRYGTACTNVRGSNGQTYSSSFISPRI